MFYFFSTELEVLLSLYYRVVFDVIILEELFSVAKKDGLLKHLTIRMYKLCIDSVLL